MVAEEGDGDNEDDDGNEEEDDTMMVGVADVGERFLRDVLGEV